MTETDGPVSMAATDLGPYSKRMQYFLQNLFCLDDFFVTTSILLHLEIFKYRNDFKKSIERYCKKEYIMKAFKRYNFLH